EWEDDAHECETGEERPGEPSPLQGGLPPKKERDGVEHPDAERDGHGEIDVGGVEAGEPDHDARAEQPETDEGDPCREAVERLKRRKPESKEACVAALQPPLLEQVETGDRSGDGEARKGGEHQADVEVERPAGAYGVIDTRAAPRPRER